MELLLPPPTATATAATDPVAFLRRAVGAATGADAQAAVEVVETHMSWVFLVGAHVLKLKKAVRQPYLDFSTCARREAACREELRLNARLAPGVYHGLMALQRIDGGLRLVPETLAGRDGTTIDWLVWMRRLPQRRMLDRLIARQAVAAADIDALGRRLAAFYRDAAPAAVDADAHVARFEQEFLANADLLLRPGFGLAGAQAALDAHAVALRRQRAVLQARVQQRRIVEGHGDLRPEHVCLLKPPVVIDALEFSARLRSVDPFEELVFLGLECHIAGCRPLGAQLLAVVATLLDDRPPDGLLRLYRADRALLRARLAIAHLLEPRPRTPQRWAPLAQRYIDAALGALQDAA